MIWALEHADPRSFCLDAATYSLDCADRAIRDYCRARWSLFSGKQKGVVADFLTFIVESGERHYDSYSAARALLNDWNDYVDAAGAG